MTSCQNLPTGTAIAEISESKQQPFFLVVERQHLNIAVSATTLCTSVLVRDINMRARTRC